MMSKDWRYISTANSMKRLPVRVKRVYNVPSREKSINLIINKKLTYHFEERNNIKSKSQGNLLTKSFNTKNGCSLLSYIGRMHNSIDYGSKTNIKSHAKHINNRYSREGNVRSSGYESMVCYGQAVEKWNKAYAKRITLKQKKPVIPIIHKKNRRDLKYRKKRYSIRREDNQGITLMRSILDIITNTTGKGL